MKIGMKPHFRKPCPFRLSVHVVISICWFAMLLNHCIIAKLYYSRIESESNPIYSRKEATAYPPPPYPNPWDPRLENPDHSLPPLPYPTYLPLEPLPWEPHLPWQPRIENLDDSLPFIESRSVRPYLMDEGEWELVDDCWVNTNKRQC